MMLRLHLRKLGFYFWLVLGLGTTSGAAPNGVDEDVEAIIDWIKSRGGAVHDKLEVRRYHPDDPASPMGMYATGDIRHGENLMSIPRETLIVGKGDTSNDSLELWCPTVFALIREMRLGIESKYAPYVNYLLTQPHGQLPTTWSKAGQDLLREVVGQHDDDYRNDLPPQGMTEWITGDWYDGCNGTDDSFSKNAAMLLVQRGWDDLMIPLYDMMSHRNGKWLNSECNLHPQRSNQFISVRSSRAILDGEQIYTSHNLCGDCENRKMGYGTPEILRDYGFVEQYPQRWFFGWGVSFELDEDDSGRVHLSWLSKSPTERGFDSLLDSFERLRELEDVKLAAPNPSIPTHELNVIVSFLNATANAMALVLHGLDVKDDFNCESGEEFCNMSLRYDDLGWQADDVDYYVCICDEEESMAFDGYEVVETVSSHYQEIVYIKDPKNDDVCFDISEITQMCDSYRPHYHEMVVHYAARFLGKIERIERVMWVVGGGDSMLLHDILKYPSLELVVGLELDQLVTRYSYKHFGTQPHFDNEKVQWWYGDAAKSLLMLPKEYFGSFDMVLVDLSETVMSALVTDGLDIFQALALLLKPRGILMKNELYLEQMSDIFDYTIQIHFPYVPVICSQSLIFGSNNIDFLWDEITDHNTENLYIKPQAEIDDRYEYFHDYRRNEASRHLCKEEGTPEAEQTEQKRSPGILLILEAEDVSTQLLDAGKLANVLGEAIQTVGFEVILSEPSYAEQGVVVTLVLREGYVMARTWPHHKYCAIDIHLWSSFEKHEAVKKALVDAIGSKSPSSYRIVAGGMFGVSAWKEDDKKRGPRVVATCHRGEAHGRDKRMKPDIASTIFRESLKLIPETDVKVAVICGVKKEDCGSVDLLEKTMGIKAVTLMSCIDSENSFEETAFHVMRVCENETYNTLTKAISNGNYIRATIIDPSAPLLFARVIYKIFKTRRNKLFDKKLFAGVAIMFDESESWRRNFMEGLRKQIFHDPSFRAEVVFNSTDSKVELAVLSSGDDLFVARLKDVVSSIERTSGLVSDVRDIKGGPFVDDPNWKPYPFFLKEDYDHREASKQWESQQPLGFQTVFQLEASRSNLGMSAKSLLKALREILNELNFRFGAQGMMDATFHMVEEAGLGCVVVALWSGGNCVILWDGVSHVDLNLFLLSEDTELTNEFASRFKSKFAKNKFAAALKDTQPRGIGRVVNFKSDIDTRPPWARFKE